MKLMIAIIACTLILMAATPRSAHALPAPADRTRFSSSDAVRLYAAGRLLEERGDSQAATDEYYRALVADPRAGAIARRVSELASRAGDTARSLEFARRALVSDPGDARALWLAGVAHFEQGQRTQALAELEAAMRADSNRIEYAQALAHVAQEMERLDVEREALRRLIALSEENSEAWFQLAAIDAREARYAEADSALEVASRLNSDRPGTDFLGGWIAESTGRDSVAIERYRRHLAAHDADQTTRRRLVTLLARQRRFDEAYREARRVSRSREGDADALLVEAELAFQSGASKAGQGILDRLVREHPGDAELHGRLIGLLARQERNRESQALAEHWAAAHPGDFRGAMLRARAAMLAADGTLALEQARAAVTMAPDSIETHALLGRILQRQRRWAEAESLWAAVVDRFPGDSGAALEIAFCREQLGDIAVAERAVRELLRREPGNAEAQNSLGYLLADHNRELPEAERLIRRAIAQQPDNGSFVDSLGWVLFRLGRLDEARSQLERAVDLTGEDPVVLEHLGDVYNKLDFKGLARQQYRRSLLRDSSNARVRGKLEEGR
ncbi:MAG: tetratricopeptide repeat protein [Candidatus Eisenbacteria bacterium]|nr:tetratricopeptide repeat protein [Candidatus Eisenbacteria bacterium]